jgi:hypothetical protein
LGDDSFFFDYNQSSNAMFRLNNAAKPGSDFEDDDIEENI